MTHSENLSVFMSDIKKVIKAQEFINLIKTTNLKSPLDELLEYGLDWHIVNSSYDVVKICHEIPELENKLTTLYDEKINEKIVKSNSNYNKYAGYYERIEDVPGYESEWDNSCIPEGVIIKNNSDY